MVAQPFNPERLELTGDVPPISGSGVRGILSASANGVLAYTEFGVPETTLTWFDRQGKVIGTTGEPHPYAELALSPDGSRVAVFRRGNTGEDLWLIEFSRNASSRLTTDPANESFPVWAPDGKQMAFSSSRGGQLDLYRKTVDGSGEEELLLKSSERYGRFSPDGRWVVYTSNLSGREEVYVSPVSASTAASATMMVSTGGGKQPHWRRDGRELYYLSTDNRLMAVEATIGPSFTAGVP